MDFVYGSWVLQLFDQKLETANAIFTQVEGGSIFTIPCCFSFINSEMVRSVNVTFFIRYIHVKFGIVNLTQSPGIGQNSDGDISGSHISG